MNPRQLPLAAAICGAAAVVAVLLPWISVTLPPEAAAFGFSIPTINGTDGDFKGTWVLILALLAGFHSVLVWKGKHQQVLPFLKLDSRQHMFLAAGLFALALVLTLTDFLRDFGAGASRGIGLWLTLLATGAGVAAAYLSTRALKA
jgi:hypothetical protein